MSPDAGRLCSGMSEYVWVKIVGVGYCLADKGHTLHSKLLFDLVSTGQLGEPQAYRHVPP